MIIRVVRRWKDTISVEGELWQDGVQTGFTLERPVIDPEGHPCIPAGAYEVIMTFSGHFQRDMPLLMDVPGRTEIRIHPANWPKQLLGCIAVGKFRVTDSVEASDITFEPLRQSIIDAIARKGAVWCSISDEFEEEQAEA